MLLILAFVLLIFVPSPWNVISFAVLLVAAGGEVAFWRRKVKDRKIEAGSETLIGALAKVVSPCRPEGEVSVEGALWRARCDQGADRDQTVKVVSRDGLLLVVEPEGSRP
ncbi:MAG TPA: NfeD family protein [Thermoleophilaceae bacterium]